MFLHFARRATSLRVGGRAARRSCLPGLRRGGGGRLAGAAVLSCLAWRCELALIILQRTRRRAAATKTKAGRPQGTRLTADASISIPLVTRNNPCVKERIAYSAIDQRPGSVEVRYLRLTCVQWCNDGVAAASSDGASLVVGAPDSSRVLSD